MLKGVKTLDPIPYILAKDNRDWDPKEGDPKKRPTVWLIAPQTVAIGNRNLAGYLKSQGKGADDALAEAYTKQDLTQFLRVVKGVRFYCFSDSEEPVPFIDDNEKLKNVFSDMDFENVTELLNASRNIFTLREGEKNALSSLSGAGSNASTRAGSDSTARPA
jgi:hypothetical protein